MFRQAIRLAIIAALLPCSSCSDSTAPHEPGFYLVSVDGHHLPVVIEVVSDFEHGTIHTSVASSRITLEDDGTFAQTVILRDASETEGQLPNRVIEVTGQYVIANDSITICSFCGDGGESSMSWKVAYDSKGFTLPLLFSTGTLRAYRYMWQ